MGNDCPERHFPGCGRIQERDGIFVNLKWFIIWKSHSSLVEMCWRVPLEFWQTSTEPESSFFNKSVAKRKLFLKTKPGLYNQWPAGRKRPSTAMDMAQHKIINFLKTLWFTCRDRYIYSRFRNMNLCNIWSFFQE